jgi:hypothetical protein
VSVLRICCQTSHGKLITLFYVNSLKSASAAKQEQARLTVEEAEDKLVQTTETAIGLMKAVLENVGCHRRCFA